jgi:hypothetical protein
MGKTFGRLATKIYEIKSKKKSEISRKKYEGKFMNIIYFRAFLCLFVANLSNFPFGNSALLL